MPFLAFTKGTSIQQTVLITCSSCVLDGSDLSLNGSSHVFILNSGLLDGFGLITSSGFSYNIHTVFWIVFMVLTLYASMVPQIYSYYIQDW